jgi:hypothetical protein
VRSERTARTAPWHVHLPPVPAALLGIVPPWLVMAALIGVINAAACFLLLGRRAAHLGWYAIIGALAAGVGQVFGTAIQAPDPVRIGELNVAAASIAVWLVLLPARFAGL